MADAVEKATEVVEKVVKETPADEKVEEDEKTPTTVEKKDDEEMVDAEKTTEEESVAAKENGADIESKIIRQVEYYFGDANLVYDKFLLKQISKDDEGWVPIDVLLSFKRLAALSTDVLVIAESLMKSDNGLVEVSEDKLKIRRHPEKPIPENSEERRKEIMSRTAYAKGFPLDADIDTLLKYFADFEGVSQVNMRKYVDKATKEFKFKGSVFVTFNTKEQAEEFIEKSEPEYKNNKLVCKWQEKYLEEKREENKAKQEKQKSKKQKSGESEFVLPKRSVIHFESEGNEELTRENIREAVEKVIDSNIGYVDYSKGDTSGHFRFVEEGKAEEFLANLTNNKLNIDDNKSLQVRTLTEEEETTYLAKAIKHMKSRRNMSNQKKHGGHGQHGRKRRGGKTDENQEKKSKLDE